MSEDARVDAVIVNWNAGDALRDCVKSLRATAPDGRVVVVDNASSDGSIATLRAADPLVHVIENRTNRGLAAANNQGIRATTSQYVLICNPDVVFRSETVPALVELLDRHSRAAFAIPRVVYPSGVLQTSVGDLPTLRDALLGRQHTRRGASGAASGFWWDGWPHDHERRVGHGLEAAYLVRRVAIDDVGYQDERYWLDWEGIDWSARIGDAGWEIWFTPAAEVVHLGGVSIRQATRRWIVASNRGMYRYFAARSAAYVRPLLALAFGGRAALKLVTDTVTDLYGRAHPGSSSHGPETP